MRSQTRAIKSRNIAKESIDKENAHINIMKRRITAVNAKPTLALRKQSLTVPEAVPVTPAKNSDTEDNKETYPEEKEIKLPVDDFVINGICAHKVAATRRALAIVSPPDVKTTKGMASPFSPLSDIQSYKAGGTRVETITRPVPQIIDFAKETMVNHMMAKNDTLECTWDIKKDGSTHSVDEAISSERDDVKMLEQTESHKVEVHALLSANEQLEAALNDAKLKCARIDEVSIINENISRVAQSLRADRDGKAQELNTLQNKLNQAHDTIKTLQHQMQSLDNLNNQLCEEIQTNQTILENKSARLEEMQSSLVLTSSPINSPLKDELEHYSRLLQAKESEVQDLKRELAHLSDIAAELRRKETVSSEELQVMQVRYQEVRAQLNTHNSISGEQQQQWQARFEAKEIALEHAEGELSAMRRQLASKEEELLNLLHSSVQSSEIASEKLQKEKESLIATKSELETANERIVQLQERDVNRTAEVHSLRTALTTEIKCLTDERSELRQSCNSYRISLDSTKERLRALETAIKSGAVSIRTPASQGRSFENNQNSSTNSSPADNLYASPAETEQGVSDKQRIATLEDDLQTARDLLVQFSKTKDDKIASMEALLQALEQDVADDDEHRNGGEAKDSSSPAKLERSLVAKFLKSEERCKELLVELTSTQEDHEKAKRTISHLTEEFDRSKQLLEKQLSSSSSSTGELANKLCDMNEKVEHLMGYSLKLTEELQNSKENEERLSETVDSMRLQIELVQKERDSLQSQLTDITQQVDILNTTDDIPPAVIADKIDSNDDNDVDSAVTYDLQDLQKKIVEKDEQLRQWQDKYVEMSAQMENAAATLEKAKQSKIKRYNKYLTLQTEYKLIVTQVKRLLSENHDLKNRHKTFVRTVEQTLVGGEGKHALAETFSTANQGAMPVPQNGAFNDFTWNAPTPGSNADHDTTASTVPSYYNHNINNNTHPTGGSSSSNNNGLHTGSSISTIVSPGSADPSGEKLGQRKEFRSSMAAPVAFEDLRFESDEE